MSAALVGLRVLAWPLGLISETFDRRVLETLTRIWGRGCTAILGIRCTVRGAWPSEPCVLVSNHLSYIDIPVLVCGFTGVFVAKAEVAGWPGLGLLARIVGTVFIERERKRDLLRVLDAMGEVLASGRSTLFFPEGTSSPGAEILPFHSSLFEAAMRSGGRAAVPVAVASLRYEAVGVSDSAAHAVCWWGDMTFPDHAYRLLGIPRIEATLSLGPADLYAENRKVLARSARDAVAATFRPTQGSERYRGAILGPGIGTRAEDLASITR